MRTVVWLKMDIIQYIEKYITIDNIVEYISIILLLLVSWCLWGKSWVMNQLGPLSKKQEDHVDKIVEEERKKEKEWTDIQ